MAFTLDSTGQARAMSGANIANMASDAYQIQSERAHNFILGSILSTIPNNSAQALQSAYTGSDISSIMSKMYGAELEAVNAQIAADRTNAAAQMKWASDENLLNYQRQQSSADAAMTFQREEREYAETFNAAQAEAQRTWEKEMSDTAITRAAMDMQNAGINPILAAGQPASTPQGASASSVGGSGTAAAGGITSAAKATAYKADTSAAISSTISYLNAKADRTQNKELQTQYYEMIERLGRYQANASALGSIFGGLTAGIAGGISGPLINAGISAYQNRKKKPLGFGAW